MGKFISSFAVLALLAAGCGRSQPVPPVSMEAPVVEQKPVNQASNPKPVTTNQTKPVVTTKPQAPGSYSWAQVADANSASKCWTVVGSGVYDLTSFINKHPGGSTNILKLCGTNGTDAFTRQHGGQEKAEAALTSLKIGTLAN